MRAQSTGSFEDYLLMGEFLGKAGDPDAQEQALLSADPLPMDTLRFSSPQEAAATDLVAQGKVRDVELQDLGAVGTTVSGSVLGGRKPWMTSVTINPDGRVIGAECTCDHYVRNKLHKGPCEHILALRLIHQREAARS